jgi:putative hydrolase of the HAD superfamily
LKEVCLPEIRAIFWDIGGVLLSNAWDHTERAEALQHFKLDEKDFNARHESIVSSFERGEITLDQYLERTVFYISRSFGPDDFRKYVLSLSKPKPEVLAFARSLASSGKYLMGTINNESRELNLYRIETFGLREIFSIFVSSCFVGMRKPESGIYKLAIELTQIDPTSCCFIDDRALNLECPAALGMKTIQMKTLEDLQAALQKIGVGP